MRTSTILNTFLIQKEELEACHEIINKVKDVVDKMPDSRDKETLTKILYAKKESTKG